MPTSKQKREAARRHLERQLQRRQQRESRRRQLTLISTVIGILVIFAVVIVGVVMLSNDNKKSPTAAGSTTPAASVTASASPTASATPNKISGTCSFTKGTAAAAKKVGLPATTVATKGTAVVKIATNRGELTFTLDRAKAPCTVASFVSLVKQKYYDNTSCHRLTTTGIYVLQCGDPTATGSGGPGYTIPDEYQGSETYGVGVLAMANTGAAHSGGSQFFIVWKDSTAGLGKTYTVFGTVTAGMPVVQSVAKAGSDNANGSGDGKPKLPLKFTTATTA
ncbi:peptidylprolyl isomerase [Jatrophihabitans telluris]|uniref:Peptidyl-prolyl cis-trans isomerase n=1 Tax=Jatrophihabitans telluris TaxID=2038343 RepID=A0ABY4QTK3_9ACTN|nr:peptidylprolyl isomerase [Jatrophihabitans telluris]UQX86798.1 peptidylprolyl isomerase [Jatrophihabitans telluris]